MILWVCVTGRGKGEAESCIMGLDFFVNLEIPFATLLDS